MRRREIEEGLYDDNREDITLSRSKPRQNGLSRDKNMSSESVFDDDDENRQLVPEVYDEMPLTDRQPVALDQSVYRTLPNQNQPTNTVNVEHPKDEVFVKSDLAMSIRSLRSNKVSLVQFSSSNDLTIYDWGRWTEFREFYLPLIFRLKIENSQNSLYI